MTSTRNVPAVLGDTQKVAALIQKRGDQIMGVLPSHVNPERFGKVILQSTRSNPSLLACTQSSFLEAAIQCASLGLEPAFGQAYLIPYKNKGVYEAQFQLGWQGMLELATRSGRYVGLEAHVVRDRDEFWYQRGLHPDLRHVPELSNELGELTHAYAIAWPKDPAAKPLWEVMNRKQIDGIRAQSRAATSGPWVTHYDEMARKTVFRRLSKWLKLTPDVQAAFDRDAIIEYGQAADQVVGREVSAALDDPAIDLPQMAKVLVDDDDEVAAARPSPTDDLADRLEAAVETDADKVAAREREKARQLADLKARQPDDSVEQSAAGAQQAEGTMSAPSEDEEASEDSLAVTQAEEQQQRYPVRTHQGTADRFPKWVGDLPKVDDLAGTLARIDNKATIAHMWYMDSRSSGGKYYHQRLAEFEGVEDPEELLSKMIEFEEQQQQQQQQ